MKAGRKKRRLAWAYLLTDCLRLYFQLPTVLTVLSLTPSTNTHVHVSQSKIARVGPVQGDIFWKINAPGESIKRVRPENPELVR